KEIAAERANRVRIGIKERLLFGRELQVLVEFVQRRLEDRRRLSRRGLFIGRGRTKSAAAPAAELRGRRHRGDGEGRGEQRALVHERGRPCRCARSSNRWRCSGVRISRTRCMLWARSSASDESAFAWRSAA